MEVLQQLKLQVLLPLMEVNLTFAGTSGAGVGFNGGLTVNTGGLIRLQQALHAVQVVYL